MMTVPEAMARARHNADKYGIPFAVWRRETPRQLIVQPLSCDKVKDATLIHEEYPIVDRVQLGE